MVLFCGIIGIILLFDKRGEQWIYLNVIVKLNDKVVNGKVKLIEFGFVVCMKENKRKWLS